MAPDNIKRVTKLRKTAVSSIHKIVRESEEIICKANTDQTFNDRIIALRDTIIEKVSYVKELDNSIIDLIEDEAKLMQADEEATEFSIFCKEKLRFITLFIDKHNNSQKEDTFTVTSLSNRAVRLPKLNIKHFDGKPER